MRLHSILAILAALGTPAMAIAADPPKLPAPYHTPSASNGPKVIQRPDGAALRVPAGFDITEDATGFEMPRYMIYGPSGEIRSAMPQSPAVSTPSPTPTRTAKSRTARRPS